MSSHRIRLHFVGLLLALLCPTLAAAHPDAVARLLCRIGGEGAAERFVTVLRPEIAAEVSEATTADADWLELDNARTLLTTWGGQPQAEAGGLHDYAYRQWQGLLSDFYYPRWHYYFTHDLQAPPEGWFASDWAWAHDLPAMLSPDALHRRYSPVPEGDPIATAQQLLRKYFGVAAQQ